MDNNNNYLSPTGADSEDNPAIRAFDNKMLSIIIKLSIIIMDID